MKIKLPSALATVFTGCLAFSGAAQIAHLPYGQISHKPWQSKELYLPSSDSEKPQNWYAVDFDDSGWQDSYGPAVSSDNCLPFVGSGWKGENYSQLVRRNFTVDADMDTKRSLRLCVSHDDGCMIYLNGVKIYESNSYMKDNVIYLDDAQKALIRKGNNIIAASVDDSGGGSAYLDFGLYEDTAPQFSNFMLQSFNGWQTSGSISRRSYNNFYYGNGYGENDYSFSQTLKDVPEGLYVLKADAMEHNFYSRPAEYGWERYPTDTVASKLFLNDKAVNIPSIFDAGPSESIFTDGNAYATPHSFIIPTTYDSFGIALANGIYTSCVYAYVKGGTITGGVRKGNTSGSYIDAFFDNLILAKVEENEIDGIFSIAGKKMNTQLLTELNAVKTAVAAAQTYEDKGTALAEASELLARCRTSAGLYERLHSHIESLKETIAASGATTNPSTLASAKEMIAAIEDNYNKGTYDKKGICDAINRICLSKNRLNFKYFDVTISKPGTLGDSILARTEYFSDVVSLKISGKINEEDMARLRDGMTNLKELDIKGVDLKDIPNRFMSDRTGLEYMVLPDNVETIGEYAFYKCALRHIDFPQTLKSIGDYAFSNTSLQEIILPGNLTSLGYRTFHNCIKNKYLKLPESLTSIHESAFYNNESLSEIDFAEGLVWIGPNAFYNISAASLHFPSTLRFIGGNAFQNCKRLSDLGFNEGLTRIEDNAFYDCDALTEVTLPSTLLRIDQSPFDYCDNLRKVTCLCAEPPYMSDQIPYGLSMEGRELYVPAISLNIYKQTEGWEKFPVIKPIEGYLPSLINTWGRMRLNIPDDLPSDYKAEVNLLQGKRNGIYDFGRMSVNGASTLSMSKFTMSWDNDLLGDNSLSHAALINNSHLRADSVEVKTYFNTDTWTFVSFPFDVKMSEIAPVAFTAAGDIADDNIGNMSWIMHSYSGADRAAGLTGKTWVKQTPDSVLQAGRGYIIQGTRYLNDRRQNYYGLDFKAINNSNKNSLFTTDNATVALNEYPSEFMHNRGWNLVGNPYPCYYDIRFMDMAAPITIWDPKRSTYTAYSPADDSYILTPGQAFFIQCPVGQNKITFDKEGRQDDRIARQMEKAPAISRVSDRAVFNLTLSGNSGYSDKTRVVINENASLSYEISRDSHKFMTEDRSAVQIFTSATGNVDYAINERPLSDGMIPLTVYAGSSSLLTIELQNVPKEYEVYLTDMQENETTDLGTSSYSFTAGPGETRGRFILNIVRKSSGIETIGTDGGDTDSEADRIYSIDGRRMSGETLQKGIYIRNGKKIIVK